MSQIGSLTTGAGIATVFSGQSQCDEYIVLGDVGTANPLQGLSVEIDGTPFINIAAAAGNAPLITAFMKWTSEFCGTAVGSMLKVATGMIGRNTTYRFTNNGATTPAVRVFSDSKQGVPFQATTKGINITSFEDFVKFSMLAITVPANISSIEIVFQDGHKATMSAQEADALFNLKNQSDALGQLGACTIIDNTDQSISSVRIFAGATALTVLIVKLPQQAFEQLVANVADANG